MISFRGTPAERGFGQVRILKRYLLKIGVSEVCVEKIRTGKVCAVQIEFGERNLSITGELVGIPEVLV